MGGSGRGTGSDWLGNTLNFEFEKCVRKGNKVTHGRKIWGELKTNTKHTENSGGGDGIRSNASDRPSAYFSRTPNQDN